MKDPNLDAWTPESPSHDFADRVLSRIEQDVPDDSAGGQRKGALALVDARQRRLHVKVGAVVVALAVVAALAVRMERRARTTMHGDRVAVAREEVRVGARTAAVLEPNAHISWAKDEVTQFNGDVFYRVDSGQPLVVHTKAGDVTVHGTCFRVKVAGKEDSSMNIRDAKMALTGAALSGAVLVGVYEGTVTLAQAKGTITLASGEVGESDVGGVRKRSEGMSAIDGDPSSLAAPDGAYEAANRSLVDTVRSYKDRLARMEADKSELAKKLGEAEKRLVATDPAAARAHKSDYDLSVDDWKQLAARGELKFRLPCIPANKWTPKPDALDRMGLAPSDSEALRQAFENNHRRLWATVRPLCLQALGSGATPELVDRLGVEACSDIVRRSASDAKEEQQHVADIRAGLKPMPPLDALTPNERVLWTMTGAMSEFEDDLARSFGPDEAHRIAYAEDLCAGESRFLSRSTSAPQPASK